MANKKLAFVVSRLPPLGGYRNRLITQVRFLSKYFDVHLITIIPSVEIPEIEDCLEKKFSLNPTPANRMGTVLERVSSFVSDLRPVFHEPYPITAQRPLLEKYLKEEGIAVVWAFSGLSGILVKNLKTKKHLDFCDSNCVVSQTTNQSWVVTWLNQVFERNLAKHFDSISYICSRDGLAAGFETKDFIVLPNLRTVPPAKTTAKTNDVVILGYWAYPPNQDALLYTVNDILPQIRRRISLVIVGPIQEELSASVNSACHDITIAGKVDNIFKYLHSSRVMLAPVCRGSGVQQKVLAGLEAGLPVLTTSFVCEGADPSKKCPAIIECSSPEEFAAQLTELLANPEQRKLIGRQGRAYVENEALSGRKAHEELIQNILS
jgi:glycosyltransferase involved in cell wall biosynthesis